MTQRQVKVWLGLWVIALNTAIVAEIMLMVELEGLNWDQATTILGFVAPMFVCYSVPALRYIVSRRFVADQDSEAVIGPFVVIAFGLTSVFAASVAGVIWLQAQGTHFDNFEQFKRTLLALEATFSVFVGGVIYALFERGEQEEGRAVL